MPGRVESHRKKCHHVDCPLFLFLTGLTGGTEKGKIEEKKKRGEEEKRILRRAAPFWFDVPAAR